MPTPDVTTGTTDPVRRLDAVATLADQLPRFMRLAHAAKAQRTADGRDRASLVLLFPLARLGSLRQSALAELLHADPSTVSRHVADLIDQGLVRRVPDETDGRASRLLMTPEGAAALEVLRTEREALLERVTADWPQDDLSTLTTLFGRLLDDLTTNMPGAADATTPREKP